MKYILFISGFIILVSAIYFIYEDQNKSNYKTLHYEMNDLEKEAVKSLSIADQAWLLNCMSYKERDNFYNHTYSSCYRDLCSFRNQSNLNNRGSSFVNSVGSSIIGYGIGKSIFGKKKK